MLPLAPLERELVRTGTAATVLVRLALEHRAIKEASCSSGSTAGGAVGAANAIDRWTKMYLHMITQDSVRLTSDMHACSN